MNNVGVQTEQMVTILTKPEANFVSLVSNGANQTPFKVVKSADDDNLTNPNQTTMSKVQEVDPTTVHKFEFSGENFDTQEKVEKYMADHGYDNFVVQKGDDNFKVEGVDASAFKSISTIEGNVEGLLMHVGKTAEEEEAAEEVSEPAGDTEGGETSTKSEETEEGTTSAGEGESTAKTEDPEDTTGGEGEGEGEEGGESTTKSALVIKGVDSKEVVSKFSYWQAEYKDTLAEVFKSGDDGFPIGYNTIRDAFDMALYSALTDGDTAQVASVASEFAEVISKFAELTSMVSDKEEVQKLLGDKPTTVDKAAETVVKSNQVEVSQGFEGIQKSFETMTATLTEKLDEVAKKSDENADLQSKRITKLESARFSRKSLAGGADDQHPETVEKSGIIDKLSRNTFGFIGGH